MDIGFTHSKVDECVYTKQDIIFMFYVDDGIIIAQENTSIDNIINKLKESYQLTDEGKIQEYLGIYVEQQIDVTTKLSQPHLIDQSLADV